MNYVRFNENGYRIHVITTDKFKTAQIHLRFMAPLERETVTKRSLLPFVMKAATENYKSKREVSKKLDYLYGASLSAGVTKYGKASVISFRMNLANEKYISGANNLFNDSLDFFSEVIYNPKLVNDGFCKEVLDEEKRLLNDEFESIYDDKIRYSLNKLTEHMCEGENFQLRAIGVKEDIDNINEVDLYNYYKEVLNNDFIDIIVVGDVDANEIKDSIKKHFNFEGDRNSISIVDKEERKIKEVRYFKETQNISQGKLNVGYRTHIRRNEEDFFPLIVMNGIFGGNPSSLLFRNVREKHSLCYYVASRLDNNKGLLQVYAGIETENYQVALDLIREQLKDIQDGNFDEDSIELSKIAIINNLRELQDKLSANAEYFYLMTITDKSYTLDDYMELVNNVTKDEIVRVANKIKEDTVFFLTNEVNE